MTHLARALAYLLFGAPVVLVATGAAPAVLVVLARHSYLFLIAGGIGIVLTIVGLLGLGLSRCADMPTPPDMPLDVAEGGHQLVEVLDPDATNPRGVRALAPAPNGGHW